MRRAHFVLFLAVCLALLSAVVTFSVCDPTAVWKASVALAPWMLLAIAVETGLGRWGLPQQMRRISRQYELTDFSATWLVYHVLVVQLPLVLALSILFAALRNDAVLPSLVVFAFTLISPIVVGTVLALETYEMLRKQKDGCGQTKWERPRES